MSYKRMAGLMVIKNMLDLLPKSERKVADYILKYPEMLLDLTATELGKRSGTSGAAVIRLCKSLGFKSYQDLKISVVGDLRSSSPREYRDITGNETLEDIISKMTENSIKAIEESVKLIDIKNINMVARLIKEAGKVFFFGLGASYLVCEDALNKFIRVNKTVYSSKDAHQMSMLIANMDENDVFFAVSYSGETKEVLELMKLASSKKAKIISLTKHTKSEITDMADINIFLSHSSEVPLRSSATSSRIAQFHMIDLIYMHYVSLFYEQSHNYIDSTREYVNQYKENLYG
jgi:DNA-binding MurR/RpiR family transcriptional regulator